MYCNLEAEIVQFCLLRQVLFLNQWIHHIIVVYNINAFLIFIAMIYTLITEPEGALTTMMELECSAINILFESRPRTKAMKFGVDVGGLFLRDKFLENSIFPHIIAPQPKVMVKINQKL